MFGSTNSVKIQNLFHETPLSSEIKLLENRSKALASRTFKHSVKKSVTQFTLHCDAAHLIEASNLSLSSAKYDEPDGLKIANSLSVDQWNLLRLSSINDWNNGIRILDNLQLHVLPTSYILPMVPVFVHQ